LLRREGHPPHNGIVDERKQRNFLALLFDTKHLQTLTDSSIIPPQWIVKVEKIYDEESDT
jgi:hypothetical protein